MRKLSLALFLFLFASIALFGCSGEDGAPGAQGPPGPPGSPQPLKVLIMSDDDYESFLLSTAKFFIEKEFFVFGSTVDYFLCSDTIPPLSYLKGYDAVLFYTNGGPSDPDALGDRLADYVDAGGGLVICTYAFSNTWKVGGRIMTTGYCPFISQPVGGISISTQQIDPSSITFPPHVIFTGVDMDDIVYWYNSNYPIPVLDSGATVLAQDNHGDPAIAVNSDGNIIAINMFPPYQATETYLNACKVIANSLIFLSGKY